MYTPQRPQTGGMGMGMGMLVRGPLPASFVGQAASSPRPSHRSRTSSAGYSPGGRRKSRGPDGQRMNRRRQDILAGEAAQRAEFAAQFEAERVRLAALFEEGVHQAKDATIDRLSRRAVQIGAEAERASIRYQDDLTNVSRLVSHMLAACLSLGVGGDDEGADRRLLEEARYRLAHGLGALPALPPPPPPPQLVNTLGMDTGVPRAVSLGELNSSTTTPAALQSNHSTHSHHYAVAMASGSSAPHHQQQQQQSALRRVSSVSITESHGGGGNAAQLRRAGVGATLSGEGLVGGATIDAPLIAGDLNRSTSPAVAAAHHHHQRDGYHHPQIGIGFSAAAMAASSAGTTPTSPATAVAAGRQSPAPAHPPTFAPATTATNSSVSQPQQQRSSVVTLLTSAAVGSPKKPTAAATAFTTAAANNGGSSPLTTPTRPITAAQLQADVSHLSAAVQQLLHSAGSRVRYGATRLAYMETLLDQRAAEAVAADRMLNNLIVRHPSDIDRSLEMVRHLGAEVTRRLETIEQRAIGVVDVLLRECGTLEYLRVKANEAQRALHRAELNNNNNNNGNATSSSRSSGLVGEPE